MLNHIHMRFLPNTKNSKMCLKRKMHTHVLNTLGNFSMRLIKQNTEKFPNVFGGHLIQINNACPKI
jgi:hypothetical protein